jgi:hypothetical protein
MPTKISKNKAGGIAQWYLPIMCEVLSLIPSNTHKHTYIHKTTKIKLSKYVSIEKKLNETLQYIIYTQLITFKGDIYYHLIHEVFLITQHN